MVSFILIPVESSKAYCVLSIVLNTQDVRYRGKEGPEFHEAHSFGLNVAV